MKRVKFFWMAMTAVALLIAPVMADQLGQESFETTTGWSVDQALGTPSSSDYCDRYDLSGTVNPAPSGLAVQLGGVDSEWFIAGEDLDGSGLGGPIFNFTLDAIDIDGYNNLSVTIAVNGADQPGIDDTDHLEIFANIDGTGDVLVGRFTNDGSSGTAFNGKLGVDYDLDGTGDPDTDFANLNDFTFPISGTGLSLVIRIEARFNSGSEEFVFDNVRLNGDLGGPTNESDAHVWASGVGAQATISSLVDTQAEKQIVHTSMIFDSGDGGLAQNTIINQITFVQGDANNISWTSAIAGAELSDGANTYVGVVNSASIVFSGAPLITLIDGGAAVDLELSVWLSTTLPYYADHSRLEFELGPSNFSVDPSGAFFTLGEIPVESGDANNEIDIVATGIGITTQPPSLVGVNAPFLVRAGFVDENNGIDEDWPAENITLSLNTGIGNLSSVGGLTIMSSNGQSAFYNLLYDALDTGVVLQATSGSYAGPALADPFDTYLAPTIVIDAYPACWDGDNTDEAVPFVVHISIENWTEAAGQDAHLKVYNGGANPFHYTDTNGWSSSTSYSHKPVITIGADGSWSGWLPIKSKGLATFKPRSRLVNNTSVQITGVNIVGTALDLTVEGAIAQDSDGSTGAAAGNVILAINESNEIIGSYLAEDNGLPLDGTIAAGGWRLAMCGVCDEEITFESWNPAAWPGNGAPEFSGSDANICAETGETVEVSGDIILPVELSSFAAIPGDGSVAINWITASESGLSAFDLLRNDETVYSVEASNRATGSEYRWTDETLSNGTTYTYALYAVNVSGNRELLATTEATPGMTDALVTEYALHQNFPNPFNPETRIAFDLVEGGFVSLKVYNLLGQEVASLVNGTMDAGRHLVSFNAADLPSGLYLYRMETATFSAQKKMVLMK